MDLMAGRLMAGKTGKYREPLSASRQECSFCHGAGERVIDIDIDGFINEVVLECSHPNPPPEWNWIFESTDLENEDFEDSEDPWS